MSPPVSEKKIREYTTVVVFGASGDLAKSLRFPTPRDS
jgi:glucose-6-phosphate 1-dehydrogenase